MADERQTQTKERKATKESPEPLLSPDQRRKLDDKSPFSRQAENTLPAEGDAAQEGVEGAERYTEYVMDVREREDERVEQDDALARERSGRPTKEQEEEDAKKIAEATVEQEREQATQKEAERKKTQDIQDKELRGTKSP